MEDIVIIGAGIVGLAVGYKLLKKNPHFKITIIEKEKEVASHQTGHNSGVIHSGIYYKPGSLKAHNCITGANQLMRYCEANQIPFQTIGKLIVATESAELDRLDELHRRGVANGVKDLQYVVPEQIQELEPIVKSAIKGIYSPHASIVNYRAVCESLKQQIVMHNCTVQTDTECLRIKEQDSSVVIETTRGPLECRKAISCCGVWADDIARLAGLNISEKMIPFRGEYYSLKPEAAKKVHALVYPVPNPSFPFLGVHLTRTVDGGVEAGPNAILALAKNGYTKKDIDPRFCLELASFSGFWRMAGKYWRTGFYEIYRSFSKKAFLKSLQKLAPELQFSDLVAGGAGIRAQLVNSDGTLCYDFCFKRTAHMIHVLNAPSPAATASLSIADEIIKLL